jgi:hypothetical protein
MKIVLPYKVKEKMRLYVESLDNEISGFGKVEFNKEEEICTITDIRIFKQKVSAGSSDLEGEDIAQFMTELTKEGESLVGWNLWWHSHNDMTVFWSGTDTGTMEENPLDTTFMVSIVTNNNGAFKARIDIYDPIHMYIDDVPVSIELPQDNSLQETIEKEVKELVDQTPPATVIYGNHLARQVKDTKVKKYDEIGYYDAQKKEWIEYDYEDDIWEQSLSDEQIEKEAEQMADQFDLDELEDSYNDALIDTEIPYDSLAIIEKAVEIKSNQEPQDNKLNLDK